MNLPNSLTTLRIFMVPILVVILLTKFEGKELWGVTVFLVAALTDFLDGYLARKRGEVTNLGKLLDPIADKLLVSAAFISLVEEGLAPAWMVVIIIGREFAVMGLRSVAATQQITIAASVWGKYKMASQVVAITLMIFGDHPWGPAAAIGTKVRILGWWALWVVVVLAVLSAVDYFLKFSRVFTTREEIDKTMIAFLRSAFIRGILLILPLAITYVILRSLFRLVHGISAPLVESFVPGPGTTPDVAALMPYLTPVISILLTLSLVLLLGLVGGNYVGRRLLTWFESVLMRVPLVKWLYGSARQIMDAFGAASGGAFREVVFVEYPRRDVWCLGFVTAQAAGRLPFIDQGSGDDAVYVFLPTTPNPTSGYTVLLKRSELRPAGMTVDDGLKLIVSGGVIAPGSLDRRGSS